MEILKGLVTHWIEINTDAITHNVNQVRTRLAPHVKLMAVVKGDAYGCGSVECADAAIQAGCNMLGVTSLEEALELRLHHIQAPILVFSPVLPMEARWYVRYNLIPTIAHKESMIALAQAADVNDKVQKFHFKIETGMGRVGILPEELTEFLVLLKQVPNLKLTGIYTHFAKAGDAEFSKIQMNKLNKAVDICRQNGLTNLTVHACASAAFLKYPQYHGNMVRIGTLLYGQAPANIQTELDLEDPWQFKVRVLQVKNIAKGESVGYGRDFIANDDMQIAVIAVGLADGFNLAPPTKAKNWSDLARILAKEILQFLGKRQSVAATVTLNGLTLPVIGRIGMQLTAIDVTGIKDIYPEQILDVALRRTAASARVTRVFKKEGKIYNVRSVIGEELGEIYDYRGERA